jgi:hypothetical protein
MIELGLTPTGQKIDGIPRDFVSKCLGVVTAHACGQLAVMLPGFLILIQVVETVVGAGNHRASRLLPDVGPVAA